MKLNGKIWIYPFVIAGMLIVVTGSCEKDDDDDDNSQTYAIGESYGGGIVFYVDGTKKHGYVAALNDQTSSENIVWGCEGTFVTGTSTAVGTGQANTTAIVNSCSANGIAARICDQLELNGFSDWFLPSKDELDLMYQNLHVQQLGNFSDFLYWSSSQIDEDNVWAQNFWDDSPFFDDGGQYSVNKVGDLYLRAMRVF
ncbi:MAG: hypothetical protein V2B15_00335 [Bacteroidota bacterium]